MKIFVGKAFYPHDGRQCYWSRQEIYRPGAGCECESIDVLAHNVRFQMREMQLLGYSVREEDIDFSMTAEDENPPCLYHRKYFPLSAKEKEEFWKAWNKLKNKAENKASG
jgi:hypothetical protein